MLALKIRTGLDIDVTGIMPDQAVWLGADKTQPVSAEGVEHLAGLPRRRGKGEGNINKPVGQPLGDAAVIALPDGQGNRGRVRAMTREQGSYPAHKSACTPILQMASIGGSDVSCFHRPELGHCLGIAPELDSSGGEGHFPFFCRGRCLAKLGLKGLQA